MIEEKIFGAWGDNTLKFIEHKLNRTGLQHRHMLSPRNPSLHQSIEITCWVGADLFIDRVCCYYTNDGSEPRGSKGQVRNGLKIDLIEVNVFWDTVTWSYIRVFQGIIPGQDTETIIRYHINAWEEEGETDVFADWPYIKDTMENVCGRFFSNQELPLDLRTLYPPHRQKTFAFQVGAMSPPKWLKEAIIYNIFVDRFHPGSGNKWIQVTELEQYMGGTLWGIVEKLDYLAELGITAIWLSPIFQSLSYHGYNIVDYEKVSEQFGGNKALHTLVREAHSRNIRVILDMVCNHMADTHPIFVDAKSNLQSPYREWFMFNDSPSGYRTFYGVASMPLINTENPRAREYLLKIGQHWIQEYDIDGYRLDHANGNSPDFWTDFRIVCKKTKPSFALLGEVIEPQENLINYTARLDACFDFMLCDAFRRRYGFGTLSERAFDELIKRHVQFFAEDLVLPTFLDSHDLDRFWSITNKNKDVLIRALRQQFSLPNPPVIYYGSEVGLTQRNLTYGDWGAGLHMNRMPMLWDDNELKYDRQEPDSHLYSIYQSLIKERKSAFESNV